MKVEVYGRLFFWVKDRYLVDLEANEGAGACTCIDYEVRRARYCERGLDFGCKHIRGCKTLIERIKNEVRLKHPWIDYGVCQPDLQTGLHLSQNPAGPIPSVPNSSPR